MDQAGCSTASTEKVKRHILSSGERKIVKNVYDGIRAKHSDLSWRAQMKLCAEYTKVSVSTIQRIVENVKKKVRPKTSGRQKLIFDSDTKYAIRRKIHGFFLEMKFQVLRNMLTAIKLDDSLPNMSEKVFLRLLRDINIRHLKRNRKSVLIEKTEIVLWRRKYLEQIIKYRSEGKRIYYTDETWVNEGYTVSKVWQDLNIKNSRQAFLEGFSTGLKSPSGKGRRLIVTHIGSESGFLDGGLNIFESRKTGDYHEDMNAEVFENWFASILPRVEPGSVIVIDNASYHSRQLEIQPTSAWRKAQIIEWLRSKNINFNENSLKVQLLELVRLNKTAHKKYVVDEMAREHGITVLRLPPYHCELNPIELIWAEMKGYVARKNTTFKLKDVKVLLEQSIECITSESWKKCILHVQKEEQKMWNLDAHVETAIEPLIIAVNNNDSDTDSDESDIHNDTDSDESNESDS